MDNPVVTVVTERGPYILEAHLTRKGDHVAIYTLTIPQNDDVMPRFHAEDPRVPMAYDPICDTWDADKAGVIVDLWEDRFNADGTRR